MRVPFRGISCRDVKVSFEGCLSDPPKGGWCSCSCFLPPTVFEVALGLFCGYVKGRVLPSWNLCHLLSLNCILDGMVLVGGLWHTSSTWVSSYSCCLDEVSEGIQHFQRTSHLISLIHPRAPRRRSDFLLFSESCLNLAIKREVQEFLDTFPISACQAPKFLRNGFNAMLMVGVSAALLPRLV